MFETTIRSEVKHVKYMIANEEHNINPQVTHRSISIALILHYTYEELVFTFE